jgi:hypothetical protein
MTDFPIARICAAPEQRLRHGENHRARKTLIDGTVEAPFSPMRARWQAEAAKAAEGATE